MNAAGHASLKPEARAALLAVARDSIRQGLTTGHPLSVALSEYALEMREPRASFVTIDMEQRLRGCIGHLQAVQPLVEDVAENAFAAAFRDPRFAPLKAEEFPLLAIHISVLSPAEPIAFSSEADLIAKLRPGIDGLILEDGTARGTFLPSVWDSLPDPRDFLAQLKRKAGLPASHWSPDLKISRYRTESFS